MGKSPKFEAEVTMGNAAFDDPAVEIVRILRGLADKIEAGATDGYIYDLNGNKVGTWYMDEKENDE